MAEGGVISPALADTGSVSKLEAEMGVDITPQRTVLRLKRRIEDSPSQVLVMSYKRRKEESVTPLANDATNLVEDDDLCRHVFCLAGSVTADKVDNSVSVAETIKKALQEVNHAKTRILAKAIAEPLKRRTYRPNEKANLEVKQQSKENRFRVISHKRGMDSQESIPLAEGTVSSEEALELLQSESRRLYNLLDLVAEDNKAPISKKQRVSATPREPGSVTVNGVPMLKEKVSESSSSQSEFNGFVYDLYVSSNGVVDDQIHDQLVSVRHADEDYEFDWGRDDGSEDGCEFEDEDSNEESNWRNEYPDTDPDNDDSGGFRGYCEEDDEVVDQLRNVHLRGDDLSSDEDADEYIYSTENDGIDDGLGGSYNRYKARKLREMSDVVVSSPSDSEID